jgi:hypothetical protein
VPARVRVCTICCTRLVPASCCRLSKHTTWIVDASGSVLGLDQAAADGVACEVDAVAHAEFAEDVGAVAFDRFDAENERRCDLV